MIKNIYTIFLIMLLAFVLIACSANNSTGSSNDSKNTMDSSGKENEPVSEARSESDPGVKSEPVKIKFSSFQSGDVANDWEQERFPDFLKETETEVEHVFINHTDTISTLLMWNAADTMPDAGMLSANYQSALAAQGMLENLTEYIKTNDPSYDLSRFFPNLLDAYKFNGDLYALPSDLDLGLLWYNKELFDQANIPYPDESWAWDDYLNAAKKLTSGEGPEKIYGTDFPNLQTFLWQNGADFISADGLEVTVDSPEAIEAITFVSDLANMHKVAPTPGDGAKFALGKSAMSLGQGPWFAHYVLADVDFEWGVAPLPKGKNKATTAYGSTFAIFAASNHKAESWEFIKWFLSDEQQMIRAKQFSWFPPASSVLDMPEFDDDAVMSMTKEQKDLVMKETNHGRAPLVVEKQNEINQIVNNELSLVWAGEKSPENAAKAIQQEVQPLLK